MKNLAILVLAAGVLVFGYLFLTKKAPENQDEINPVQPIDELADGGGDELISTTDVTEEAITEETEVVKINIKYPSFGYENLDSEIKTFVQEFTSNFKTENSEAYPGQPAKNSLGSRYRVVESDSTVSVILNLEMYTGGAHGNLFIKTFVYEKDGDRLAIGSFFEPRTNYLGKLSEISKTKLKEKGSEQETWFDEGTDPVSSNFEAFFITEEGDLGIIFQPYQVGPWVIGTPEINIPFSEFGTIVTNDYR